MIQHTAEFLTTKEVAELLRIKERRLYDLAAAGEIPCTRALGKLLFQRSQLEAWLASHASGLPTSNTRHIPRVLLGSYDAILEWAVREANTELAILFDGGFDGLERFVRREGLATGLHVWHTGGWNDHLIKGYQSSDNVALVEWAWRQRGLAVASGNPKKISGLTDLRGLRISARRPQSATQALLVHLLSEAGLQDGDVMFSSPVRTESEAALSISEGQADAALCLAATAQQNHLDFIPLIRERFDLLIRHSDWFDEPFQRLVMFTRSDIFRERIHKFPGYDFSSIWRVHFTNYTAGEIRIGALSMGTGSDH